MERQILFLVEDYGRIMSTNIVLDVLRELLPLNALYDALWARLDFGLQVRACKIHDRASTRLALVVEITFLANSVMLFAPTRVSVVHRVKICANAYDLAAPVHVRKERVNAVRGSVQLAVSAIEFEKRSAAGNREQMRFFKRAVQLRLFRPLDSELIIARFPGHIYAVREKHIV